MITNLLKEHRKEVYALIQKSPQAKSTLRQLDNTWKKIEKIITKELK